ncbi:MAG: deoxyribodipyrimidine photo-lyase [Methylococcales bacterium]|nr:MAG: deoxyribodipyrimidine photo-lyase [Methylococcales bacterium]
MPVYNKSLFIFRRDLRLQDNTALNEALRLSKQVLPCFIFDPRQIDAHPYQSQPALHFMLQSIADLDQQLQSVGGNLTLYKGLPDQVIACALKQQSIQAVFINRDYTPFSRRRDAELAETCQKLGLSLYILADALLTEPEQALKSDQTPYKVFTAFYNNARQIPVALPQALSAQRFLSIASEVSIEQVALSFSKATVEISKGGRLQALGILEQLAEQADYLNTRDFPVLDSTSKLSAHLKFGTCSVREVYYALINALGSEHPLIRQLYWRDFFTHIAYHYPRVFGKAFLEKFANLHWDNNLDYFQAWADGRTGFPIVDAGMRELNATGFMHNRVRMIVASFLVKDLHVSWRWGERYFAQHLVDYDPCVNNGNWQWAASTGCDAQPYFRIFNPWLQQQKFDADCQYIYRWIPELKAYTPKIIHQWHKKHQSGSYPAPIIDHAFESDSTKARFKDAILNSVSVSK